jgi:hypothetical protein
MKVAEFLPILRGVFWSFWVDFHGVGSISNIFGGRFSPFCCFFNLETRYTRSAKSTLCSSPSRNDCQAPQLGPRGVVFVQLVDLGLNPLFPWVESWLSTRSRCRWHWWDPLPVLTTRVREGGDPGGSPPLFSLYFGLPNGLFSVAGYMKLHVSNGLTIHMHLKVAVQNLKFC